MSVFTAIRNSLNLLSRRDRRVLVAVVLSQMATSFLDLIGILLIGLVAAIAISAVSGQPLPDQVQSALDSFGLQEIDPIQMSLLLAVAAAVVLISKSAASILITRRVLRFLANRQAVVSGRLVAGLLSQPLLQIQKRSSQETAYALTSGVAFSTLIILGQGIVGFSELALLSILSVGLFLLDPLLTLFTVGFFLIIALILQRLLSGWALSIGTRVANAEVASLSIVHEALRTYREITVSQRRYTYIAKFQDLRWQAASFQANIQFIGLIPKYVFEVALIVGAGLLAFSQFVTKDLNAAVATIAIFLAAGSRILPSLLRLQGAIISVQSASTQAAPTFELAKDLGLEYGGTSTRNLPEPEALKSVMQSIESGHIGFQPRIEVRGVSLHYPGTGLAALEDVSLTVAPGQSLALVGTTGAGKSSLADVILGVLEPDSGVALIAGLPPLQASIKWPGAIAYVPQDVAMVNGTIRENVALGLPGEMVDDLLVHEALERARLNTFLKESRNGLDTHIGENGVRLSGGQRQRLGIARALYTKPRLLVLDEATSALDSETESAISETLIDLEGTVTTVTVAHRLATIRHCDIVVYLEKGRVSAMGSFDDVRNASTAFDRQASLLGL